MREDVRLVIANRPAWGPERILARLREAAKREGWSDQQLRGLPSASTIGRIKREFSEEERQKYEYVSWPETFQSGLLPWEAARPLLDLKAQGSEVTVRHGYWYWRAWQAAGGAQSAETDAPHDVLWALSTELAWLEAGGAFTSERLRSIEFYIALRGWEDEQVYQERLASIPDAPDAWMLPPPIDLETVGASVVGYRMVSRTDAQAQINALARRSARQEGSSEFRKEEG